MDSRERVMRAVSFQPVDKIALECNVNAVALYEHGEKIRELFKTIEGDFSPVSDDRFPMPSESDFDENGNYLSYRGDEWGVKWVYRIFGIQGHPVKRPLDDWDNLDSYKLPPIEKFTENSPEYVNAGNYFKELQAKRYYAKAGWIGLLERSCSLRKFEDVLADLVCGDKDFVKLTDRLAAYHMTDIQNLLSAGVDGIQFGDDFGTQNSMLISPEIFRDFYKPRFRDLIEPIKKAGKQVFFHCCGYVLPILEDLKEIGVDIIWPQLSAYNLNDFASICRDIGLAVAIHPERSQLMTRGTPEEVYRRVYEYAETFRPQEGGSLFYLEIDNGFPYENIEAMIKAVREMRQ